MRYGHRYLCLFAATVALAALVACGGGSRSSVVAGGADVALAGSREWAEFPAGFDILPPINQPRTGLGALNPDAMPVIEIYTGSDAAPGSLVHRVERPEIAIVDGHFQYDWDTDGSSGGLPAGTTNCVIEIHWGSTFLGFADCVVDRPNGKGKKATDSEFFDLVSGRTLPIKFIIDGTVPTPPPVAVTVAPADVTLAFGATQQFVATVTGASNTSVTWAVLEAGGGSITAAGVYTAPAAEGTYHVVATSVEDPTKSATATVTVACTAGGEAAVPWVAVPPVIDGRVNDAEWANANHVVWRFSNQAGTRTRDYNWWLEHDGTWLYLGTRTPLSQQWDTYVAMMLDGDDNDQFVGSLSGAPTDLLVGKPGPGAWGGYDYYNAGNTGQHVAEPLGTARERQYVDGQLQFEFKIKLSELATAAGSQVGAFFLTGEDGTAGNQDKYPATASGDSPCGWLELLLSDVPPPAPAFTWDAYRDFSTSQGALGVWYYEYFLASTSTYGNLIYGRNPGSNLNEWYTPTPPSASYGQPRIMHDPYFADAAGLFAVQPGDDAKRLDGVFKWVAPHAGTFVVSGTIKGVYDYSAGWGNGGPGGDGFKAHLLVNGVERWTLDVPSYGPPTTIPPLSVALGSSDVVRLHIDHKTSTYYDIAAANLTVTEN